jgi:signal transduction histidine kinase
MTGGTAGGLLVAACWSAPLLAAAQLAGLVGARRLGVGLALAVLSAALLLAAPWVARAVAGADEAAGRALLGPSRSEELALRVEALARSRAEILAATDAERRRIERDLHDGTQRRLVSLAMRLGMARAKLADAPEPAREAIEQAHDEATEALAELRQLVRGLHPAVLDDRGLDAALSGIAANAPLPVRLRVDVGARCSPAIEAVAYFVVSEALTNVAKHAGAGHAEVTVERSGDRLRVVVADDGRGGAILDGGVAAADGGGTGLRGLAQRAAAVDGTLTVHSPPGGPTVITVELPCES